MRKMISSKYIWGPLLYALTACSVPTAPNPTSPSASPTQSSAPRLSDLSLPTSSKSPSSPSPAPAVSPSPSPTADGSAYRLKNILYWKVQAADTRIAPSYLVGTAHLNLADGYTWPDHFTQALKQSTALYIEADTQELENNPQAVVEKTLDPEQRLIQALDNASVNTLATRLVSLGLPPSVIPVLQAWYINILLSTPPAEAIADPQSIMDNALRAQAVAAQVPINYLEKALDQLDMMAAIPFEEHLRLIKDTLSKPAQNTAQELQASVKLYNQGDLEAMEQLLKSLKAESLPLYTQTIAVRNQKWLDTLQPVLATRGIVVAVGSLHLLGDEGLIAQLQAAGFTVEQVEGVPTP